MKYEKEMIVTLGNKKEYVVVETLEYNNKQYLYLAGLDDESLSIVKVLNDKVLSKLSKDEFEDIYSKFQKIIYSQTTM